MKTFWLLEAQVSEADAFYTQVDLKSWGVLLCVKWHRFLNDHLSLEVSVQVGPVAIGFIR